MPLTLPPLLGGESGYARSGHESHKVGGAKYREPSRSRGNKSIKSEDKDKTGEGIKNKDKREDQGWRREDRCCREPERVSCQAGHELDKVAGECAKFAKPRAQGEL